MSNVEKASQRRRQLKEEHKKWLFQDEIIEDKINKIEKTKG